MRCLVARLTIEGFKYLAALKLKIVQEDCTRATVLLNRFCASNFFVWNLDPV